MGRISRRRAGFAAVGALVLSLLAGGIATASPGADDAQQGRAAVQQQPVATKAQLDAARAAMKSGPSVSALPTTARTSAAVVSSGGVLNRGINVVSSLRLATGQYQVVFDHDVTRGTFVGTLGLTGSVGISPPGEIAVVGRTGIPNGVFVQTWNSAGVRTDRAFHLAVHD
ncbi:hypothetical protein [Micromonospora echinofusca]|uniref:Secreted protein n=1 Tax=Micromonospora echinofusca TaxID=47858 RepID=A0ABS3VVX8_MICEH|nr:hypothetical protein [Micromonospora echinofusca]MBO4208682.1 hypothetical protein [Micromonospora echinofusca]